MPIEITLVFIRPSAAVPWFHETWPPSHAEYIKTHYKDTGKFEGSSEQIGETTLINTFRFASPEAMEEFISDPYLVSMKEARDIYNRTNNIELLG
jgi:hypothetical protein